MTPPQRPDAQILTGICENWYIYVTSRKRMFLAVTRQISECCVAMATNRIPRKFFELELQTYRSFGPVLLLIWIIDVYQLLVMMLGIYT